MRILLIGSAALSLIACDAPIPFDPTAGTWVDLTHGFDENTVYWPTADGFKIETVAEGVNDAGYFYSAFNIATSEHGGTHLDAPYHFAEDAYATDEIPLERLIGPGAVIDVGGNAEGNRDYLIAVEDIEAWEAEHGRLPDGAMVLFNTGSAKFWPDPVAYMGAGERGAAAVAQLHFPGLHVDAATFLAEERNIAAVGLDTPSIDYGQSTDFMSHRILYAKNISGLENIANLDALPATGATIIALPMKIKGGSGGPLRIVAYIP